MFLDKSIERIKARFDECRFTYGERPKTAFEGAFNAYIHVPFCTSRCEYCPFYKEVYREVKKCGYMKSVLSEINHSDMCGRVIKLRIGGGMPNLLSIDDLGLMINAIREKVEIEEISLEANPEILTTDYVDGLKQLGVTELKLSISKMFSDTTKDASDKAQAIISLKKIVAHCKERDIKVRISILAGMPGQRETSFIEKIHFILELEPYEIKVQSLMHDMQERAIELAELAAEILIEYGYSRRSLWNFSLSTKDASLLENTCDEQANRLCIGFGPSAYTRHENWQSINPEIDMYIYEHEFGKARVLWRNYEQDEQDLNRLLSKLSELDATPDSNLPIAMNIYLRWLGVSGLYKNNTFSGKGIRHVQKIVHDVYGFMPNPLADIGCIDNVIVYEAERAFSSLSIRQLEVARDNNPLF